MENMTTSRLSATRNLLVMLSVVVVTVGTIVLSMPNTEQPLLYYTLGEPWLSPQLISPAEIPIRKDATLLEQERNEALRTDFLPYYTLNTVTGEKQVNSFLQKYTNSDDNMSAYAVQIIAGIMRDLYGHGIMSQSDYGQLMSEDSTFTFMLAKDNEAVRTTISEINSTKMAYEKLMGNSRVAKYRELMQTMNLEQYIVSNVKFDQDRSEQSRRDIIALVPENTGMMKPGQEIINRGDIVDEDRARMIDSYNEFIMTKSQNDLYTILLTNGSQALYVLIMITIALAYIYLFRKDYYAKPRSLYLILCLLGIFSVMHALFIRVNPRFAYITPICLVPIFIRIFLDSRTAVLAHMVTLLICSATVTDKFEYIVVQFVAGITAIYSLREVNRRSQTFNAAILVMIAYIVMYTILKCLNNPDMTFESMKHYYYSFVLNGVLLLLAYPLMYLVEKMFGFISTITLIELSDTNRGLLRRLSEIAPGTFQHSFMVSNLAGAVATEIDAKPLLVRVGALYHDIGKMVNPAFFTENQHGINPHTRLTPQESAKIIIGHVAEGVQLAEENDIPQVIRNFIRTHHGKSLARYFYNTYKNAHPDEEVDDRLFRYPGPNPFSKETAILMMCDSVEAASRSLTEYDEDTINQLVNNIIDTQVREGYLQQSPITFRDIETVKRVLKEKLISIHHPRIKYPELKK